MNNMIDCTKCINYDDCYGLSNESSDLAEYCANSDYTLFEDNKET